MTTSTDTEEPKGTVINQNPEGGTERPEGDSVTIVVSRVRGTLGDPVTHRHADRDSDGPPDRDAQRGAVRHAIATILRWFRDGPGGPPQPAEVSGCA